MVSELDWFPNQSTPKTGTRPELVKNWKQNQLTKKYIKYSNFDLKIYIHVHPCESKPLDTNMQSFLMYIASKGAYNQNSTSAIHI
jgi:hypothetical protein